MYKLCAGNFHAWKSRIKLVLLIKELDEYIEYNPPGIESEGYHKWVTGETAKLKPILDRQYSIILLSTSTMQKRLGRCEV